MKLFVDTANLSHIEKLANLGLVKGVTTNPSLFAKEPKGDFNSMCKDIAGVCRKLDMPLSVEVFSLDPEEAFKEAIELCESISYGGLSIKIPINTVYLPMIKKLSNSGVQVNATCGYTANQLIAAAACGARYVSLFYRRAIDAGEDVELHLQSARNFIESNNLECEIIAGSIREPKDILLSWKSGAHIATAGPQVIDNSLHHAGTDDSIHGFFKDFCEWSKK